MIINELFLPSVESIKESVDTVLQEFYEEQNKHEPRKIFPGEVYKDKSRIPKIKRGLFSRRRQVPTSAGIVDRKFFEPIFLLGFEAKGANVFFEIWYDPFTGNFSIYDKYGMLVGQDRKKLRQSVDDLADIVSDYDDSMDSAKARDRLEREAARMRLNPRLESPDAFLRRRAQQMRETHELIGQALEESVQTRAMLGKIIGADVEEYKTTRMRKYHFDKWWRRILGRFVIGPSDHQYKGILGGIRKKWDEVRGAKKEASFVVGYSLANLIDVEIWYVKDVQLGRGRFYVFDLTGGDELGSGTTLKDALQIVSDKIKVPYDYE